MDQDHEESDEGVGHDFIVGPESNHSKLKKRQFNRNGSNEDVEEGSKLAKKRKVRKAAKSTIVRGR